LTLFVPHSCSKWEYMSFSLSAFAHTRLGVSPGLVTFAQCVSRRRYTAGVHHNRALATRRIECCQAPLRASGENKRNSGGGEGVNLLLKTAVTNHGDNLANDGTDGARDMLVAFM